MPIPEILSVWQRASNMDKDLGIPYYANTRAKIASSKYSCAFDRLALIGAFVALSPNNDENGNYRDLDLMCEAVVTQEPLSSFRITGYPRNLEKAWRILHGEYPPDVLRGPKTRAFFYNILDPNGAWNVTIDGHMFSVWHGRRYRMREAKMNEKMYYQISADFRTAAKLAKLTPCQFQSVIWLTWKRIHNIRFNPQFKFQF